MLTVVSDRTEVETLPAMLDKAQRMLEAARTHAEVLEARFVAAAAYDVAARIARQKQAFGHIHAVVVRMQAQALLIESRAKSRLADEYDAARARGEVAGHGGGRNFNVPDGNVEPTAADLGLRRREIHEARKIRDAERADPGAIERSVEAAVADGVAPTRARLKRDLGIDPKQKPKAVEQPTPEKEDDPVEIMRGCLVIFEHPFLTHDSPVDWSDPDQAGVIIGLRGLSDDEKALLYRAKRSLEILIEEMENGPTK